MQQQGCRYRRVIFLDVTRECLVKTGILFFYRKKHLLVVLVKDKIPSRKHEMEQLIRKYERCPHEKCDLRVSQCSADGGLEKKSGTSAHHTRFCPACMCDIMVTLCCPPPFRPSLPVGTFANFYLNLVHQKTRKTFIWSRLA